MSGANEDATFRGRLRLRHTDRFVLPLLRGRLTGAGGSRREQDLWLVDTTAAGATCSMVKVSHGFASGPSVEHLVGLEPVSSREGLLLVRGTNNQSYREELLVCDPATRRTHRLPPQPDTFPRYFTVHDVLLVGDDKTGGAGEFGRQFQVLSAIIMTSDCRADRCLQIQTFSYDKGMWGPFTEIRIPNLRGQVSDSPSTPVVVEGVLHMLCPPDRGSYVLMFHVKAEKVTLTTLPTRFPRPKKWHQHVSYLFATNSMGGSLVVLVADYEKISMWVQCKHTKRWKEQPQVVIKNEEILRFDNVGNSLEGRPETVHIELLCFSERSGAVLIKIPYWCFFWLDLQSKKIVKWFSDDQVKYASIFCPYEMELSSWVPTFSSRL